jgi:ABC-type transporter MlaC component
VTAEGGSADVRWVLVPVDGEFRLVDVVTEGSSMVAAQRASFARVVARGGAKRLFKRLEDRLADLRAELAAR